MDSDLRQNDKKQLWFLFYLNYERPLCAEACLFDLNLERQLSGSGHRNPNIECVLGAHYRHFTNCNLTTCRSPTLDR